MFSVELPLGGYFELLPCWIVIIDKGSSKAFTLSVAMQKGGCEDSTNLKESFFEARSKKTRMVSHHNHHICRCGHHFQGNNIIALGPLHLRNTGIV